MISVLYGTDEFRISEKIKSIRASLSSDDLGGINNTFLNASESNFDELLLTAAVVPFMSERRLVVGRDFIKNFSSGSTSSTVTNGLKIKSEDVIQSLSDLPNSTVLVLQEGDLNSRNPLLQRLKKISEVENFSKLRHVELVSWIKERTKFYGGHIENSAAVLMANYIGFDLRTVDSEITKLVLYKNPEMIEESDVVNLVSYTGQQNIFKVVDTCIGKKVMEAIRSSANLVQSGESPFGIVRLLERQIRLLIRAKILSSKKISKTEMSKRLSLVGYPLQKTLEQEKLLTLKELKIMHGLIVASDLRVKKGQMDETASLQTLIVEIGSV